MFLDRGRSPWQPISLRSADGKTLTRVPDIEAAQRAHQRRIGEARSSGGSGINGRIDQAVRDGRISPLEAALARIR